MTESGKEELLRHEDSRPTTFMFPESIHEKLGSLVAGANDEGVNTSKKEMVGALIAFANLSDEELADLVMKYRKAKVTDIIPE